MPATHRSVIALDVGHVRVGVAVASLVARLPRPLITLERDDTFWPTLKTTAEIEDVAMIIVGWPRGMQGQHTKQTETIEAFVKELRTHFALPIHMQDEALTSRHAEEELRARGKPYDKGAIDALAATYILEDFLQEHSGVHA